MVRKFNFGSPPFKDCGKVLYIGASFDTRILDLLDCKTFILIDPSPNSHGMGYNDKNFISILLQKLFEKGYILKNNELLFRLKKNSKLKVCLNFTNGEKTLKYYINTLFPKDVSKKLKQDIADVDTLYIKGFHPSQVIINYIKSSVSIIISKGDMLLPSDEYELEEYGPNIIDYMYQNPGSHFIKSITMFNLHNYRQQKFKTINEAELWRQKYYSKNNTFGKSKKKYKRPSSYILKLARKYGIKITIKRNGKRVYKSSKLIKKNILKKIILKKKKLK